MVQFLLHGTLHVTIYEVDRLHTGGGGPNIFKKVKTPKKPMEFRPIALCNVFYKIIAKVMANRMKQVLPFIISEAQSAFVAGRQISDNVLEAFEIFHHLKNQRTGRSGDMALKLDMSKAYDRVEWSFLQQMMEKLGFSSRWVNLIMACVTSVQHSVLINGSQSKSFSPSRGLRQGDPPSPYLFLLCAEGFSALLRQAEANGALCGVSICKRGPFVSHLFFANDSLLFGKATPTKVRRIKQILELYEVASGQKINLYKSTITFNKNTPAGLKEEVPHILGVSTSDGNRKYLGMPTMIGRSKREVVNNLEDRIWKRIQGWKEKLLSMAGKEVLIKVVAQAISTYVMSRFKVPHTLYDEIIWLISSYWWGDKENKKLIHWLRWDRLCSTKKRGGVGFKDLKAFNDALLAKQGWRLITQSNSLAARLLKEKYFPYTSFLHAQLGTNVSYSRRSIMCGWAVLLAGLRPRIGNGENVSIWNC